ncbi:hypothetical protein D3C85_1579990 [compost metagenome]
MAPILATALATRYGDLSPVAYYVGGIGILASVCAHFMRPSEPAGRHGRVLDTAGPGKATTGG